MKILRAFVIGLIGLWTFAVCALLGTKIGFSQSGPDYIARGIQGFMIGSLVGVIAAIVVARFFTAHVWVGEKKIGESTTNEIQQ